MATAKVKISNKKAIVNKTPRAKRVVLKQVEGNRRKFVFPFGPKEIRYEGNGLEYINIERPGSVALLEAESSQARTIAFDAVIADAKTGGKRSQESVLNLLKAIAREDSDLTFTHGVRSLKYRVRLTNLAINSVQRDLNGNITQASVSIQLTERPRRTIDPVTLNAIRYTPTSSPPSKTTKTTTTSTKTSTVTSAPHINVDPIVNSPYSGGGGGSAPKIN